MSNKRYKFHEDNIYKILTQMKKTHPVLAYQDTDYLCKVYSDIYSKNEEGFYIISEEHILALLREVKDRILLGLAQDELVEMAWSDQVNRPLFRITPSGKSYGLTLKNVYYK